jgi:hypothetical protein
MASWSRIEADPVQMALHSGRSFPRSVALVLLATTALAGCSDIYYDRRETVSFGADDAVVSNRVIHMVDPWPRYVGDRNIAFNGERIQAGVERYRRHEVILPRPYSTNNMSQQNMTTYTESVPVAAPAAPSTPAAPVK